MSRFALVTPGNKRVSSARRAAPMIRRCRLSQIVDADVRAIPAGGPNGTDMLDVALCAAGIFARSPRRGTSRRRAEPPRTVEQLVALRIPPPFDKVTVAYVTAYQQRVSRNYSTTRTKIRSLAYFSPVIDEVLESTLSRQYFDYLRHRLLRASSSSKE